MKRLLALALLIATPTFAATISGNVTPAGGMAVQAYDASGVLRAAAVTNAAGNYVLTLAASGSYRVLAFDPNGVYATSFYNAAESFDTSTPVDVVNSTSGIDFTLARGGIVSGVVTSSSGSPLALMTVAAYNADGTKRGFTTTDTTGHYQLTVPPGTYDVAAYDDTLVYLSSVTHGSSVVAAATTTDNFQLIKAAVLSGTVTDAVTGTAVANATLSLYANGIVAATATADASGHYRVVLAPGTYRVVAFDPAGVYAPSFYANAESFDSSTLLALNEGDAPVVNAQLVRAGKFAGHVTDAATNAALAAMTVAVYNPDGTTRAFTTTDGNGNYVLVVPPGSYRLAAYDATASALYLRSFAPSALSAFAAQTTTENFPLTRGAVVTGTVSNATLATIAGISVSAYDATGLVTTTTTDANGNYRLLLAGGAYTLAAFDRNFHYATGYDAIAVANGQSLPSQNFTLVAGARVSGTVVDASTNALLAGMTVAAYDGNGVVVSTAITSTNGTFDLMLPAGAYSLAAFDPLHRYGTSAPLPLSVATGQIMSGLSLRLPPSLRTLHHRAAAH